MNLIVDVTTQGEFDDDNVNLMFDSPYKKSGHLELLRTLHIASYLILSLHYTKSQWVRLLLAIDSN